MFSARVRSGVLLNALFLLLGCSGSGKPIPVKGTVTFDDRPLPRASVVFFTQEPEGRDANGFTDAQGVFQLTTFRPNDGALPGKYKVVVQYSEEPETPTPFSSPGEAQRAIASGQVKLKTPSIIIPPVYSQPNETVLTQEIPATTDIVLHLHSKPR
jgi:hypothetical protein